MLTLDRLREVLHYDDRTGVFTWRIYRDGKAPAVPAEQDVAPHYLTLAEQRAMEEALRRSTTIVNVIDPDPDTLRPGENDSLDTHQDGGQESGR